MLRIEKDTTFDRIFAHYVEDVVLTKKESEIKERWEAAWSLLCNYHSSEQAKPIIAKRFDISERQALRDIRNAILLFGDVTKSSKEGYRHILFEYSMKVWQLAAKNNNIQEMNRAIANMIKIKGLDKEDPDKIDWADLEPHIIKFSLNHDVKSLIKQSMKSGKIDLDNMLDITDLQKTKNGEFEI